MSLEGVSMVLRNLRSRLDLDRALAGPAGDTSAWPVPLRECTADLDAYDQALVSAAGMVDVVVPAQPPGDRRFSPDQRSRVEEALMAAGVQLSAEAEGAS